MDSANTFEDSSPTKTKRNFRLNSKQRLSAVGLAAILGLGTAGLTFGAGTAEGTIDENDEAVTFLTESTNGPRSIETLDDFPCEYVPDDPQACLEDGWMHPVPQAEIDRDSERYDLGWDHGYHYLPSEGFHQDDDAYHSGYEQGRLDGAADGNATPVEDDLYQSTYPDPEAELDEDNSEDIEAEKGSDIDGLSDYEQGYIDGLSKGHEDGYFEGFDDGYFEGYDEGFNDEEYING